MQSCIIRRLPPLCLYLLVLLTSAAAFGKTVPVGKTAYTLTAPDNFLSGVPAGDMFLVEVKSPADDIVIQALLGAPDSTTASMATDYEGRIRQAFTTFTRTREEQLMVAGVPTLYRRYNARAEQQAVTVQAFFFARDADRFILHSLSLPEQEQASLAIMQSFSIPAPVAPPAPTAIPMQRIEPKGWSVSFEVPANWRRQTLSQAGESLTGAAGTPAAEVGLTVQKFSRGQPAHRDLAASTETALGQVRRMPTAGVLRKEPVMAGATPASLLEIGYPSQGKPRRMMLVLLETPADVYWFSFAAPREVYHQQVELFERAVASITTSIAAH